MPVAIEVERLVKEYRGHRAVKGISFAVPTGTVLGLLGPNGAGKTTTVRMLATLLRPDGGRARVGGFDLVRESRQVRRVIGLTGQFAAVDGEISGWENLYMIARLHNMSVRRAKARTDELLAEFALADVASKLARGYSGGMRRRLDLAASMVAAPEVLYLDEPTTGLDPRTRNALWDTVRAMVRDGTTVLLTTQYMEEAEALAEEIVVMDRGEIVASGTTDRLRAEVGGQVLRIKPVDPINLDVAARVLATAGLGRCSIDDENGVVSVGISGPSQLTRVVQLLARSGLPVSQVDTHVPSLDEVFLTLTGQPRMDSDAPTQRMVLGTPS